MTDSASPSPYTSAVSTSVPPASRNALELRGRVVGVGVPPPRHGAEREPGHRQPATAERSLLHGLEASEPAVLLGSGGWGVAYPDAAPPPGGGRGNAVRLGLNLGYQSAWTTPADHLALAQEADRLGYSVVWAAEAYGSDSPSMLAWIAGQTDRIDIGAAVMQIPARTPATTAMTAATIDALSGGRFRLGLGVSGPQVSEGWHGVRFAKPLARTREYVDIVKLAIARKQVEYEGEHYTLPLPDGPGKALRLGFHPPRDHIPIYLAAVGPKNLELAGEIADGWLAIFFAPEFAGGPARRGRRRPGQGRPDAGRLRRRADRAGGGRRRPGDACAELVRWYAALYIGGMGSREQNFYNELAVRMGYGDAAREVQDLYLAKRQRDAAAAVPLEFIDRTSLLGPKERIADTDARVRRGRRHHAVGEPVRRRPGQRHRDAADRRRGAGPRRSGGMTWVEAIVLGIVQGLTEFLPVSSSAHLRITSAIFFDEDAGASFTAVTQLGTEAAVLLYFAKDIWRITYDLVPGLRQRRGAAHARLPDGLVRHHRLDPDRRRRLRVQGPDPHRRPQPVAGRDRADRVLLRARVRRVGQPADPDDGAVRAARRHRDGSRPGGRAGPRRVPLRRDDQRRAASSA